MAIHCTLNILLVKEGHNDSVRYRVQQTMSPDACLYLTVLLLMTDMVVISQTSPTRNLVATSCIFSTGCSEF